MLSLLIFVLSTCPVPSLPNAWRLGRRRRRRREYVLGMGQRILCLAGEMGPSHARGFDVLREITREVGGGGAAGHGALHVSSTVEKHS